MNPVILSAYSQVSTRAVAVFALFIPLHRSLGPGPGLEFHWGNRGNAPRPQRQWGPLWQNVVPLCIKTNFDIIPTTIQRRVLKRKIVLLYLYHSYFTIIIELHEWVLVYYKLIISFPMLSCLITRQPPTLHYFDQWWCPLNIVITFCFCLNDPRSPEQYSRLFCDTWQNS